MEIGDLKLGVEQRNIGTNSGESSEKCSVVSMFQCSKIPLYC
jgi:hypothetical protein